LQSPGFVSRLSVSQATASCETLKDSNTDLTGVVGQGVGNVLAQTYLATKFTAGSSYNACAIEFLIGKGGATGLPTGNVFAYVWSDSSGPSTLLAQSGAVDSTTLPAVGTTNYIQFTFDSPASLSSGTVYWIGLSHTNVNANNYVRWLTPSAFVAGGVYSATNGSVWASAVSKRANFKTYSQ
jgi:hypothetical protein